MTLRPSDEEGQQPAVPVLAGLDFQPCTFVFQKVGREPAGISTVILHMLVALSDLECVHDDQPHLPVWPSADRPSETAAGTRWIAADDPYLRLNLVRREKPSTAGSQPRHGCITT
jgi:hypothetical protein